MHTPTSAEVIQLWERGVGRSQVDVALSFLAAVEPGRAVEQLAALSVAERDARLVTLREALFGPALQSLAQCPRCDALVQFTIDVSQLRDAGVPSESGPFELLDGDVRLRFRAPNSADLAGIVDYADALTARRALAESCVVEAWRGGTTVQASEIPEHAIEHLATSLAETQKSADHHVQLRCVGCNHEWTLVLDIVSFLSREIDALAKRLLIQVHELAWAYGWRETDILAMSDARRQWYLAMVR